MSAVIKQAKMEDRSWNQVWQCTICKTFYSVEEPMQVVSMVAGLNQQGNMISVIMQARVICTTCMETHGLEKEQPKIVLPNQNIQVAMPNKIGK